MKVLVVGSGGREHALCWKIAQSRLVDALYCAPGNAGIAEVARCVPVNADNVTGLLDFAVENGVALTVVGPELPLTLGIADLFREKGLLIVGPDSFAARLEGSKAFAKEIMRDAKIPTANYRVFDDPAEAERYVKTIDSPCVVKADGLAAGKGVIICKNSGEAIEAIDALMRKKTLGDAGNSVIIEDLLEGEEVSFIALTDGERVVALASSQDHKRVGDGDTGPNTGGMGAYSPAPVLTPALHETVMSKVMVPAVSEMRRRGGDYRGFIYAGLMICGGKPHVLEFNVRLGDPETQPLMFRMRSDLVRALLQAAMGKLEMEEFSWDPRPAVCVVMAAEGYPGSYPKGMAINGIEQTMRIKDTMVFQAGTALKDGKIVASGGRVLGVTAMGEGFRGAIENAYKAVSTIDFEHCHYRKDIGHRALMRDL